MTRDEHIAAGEKALDRATHRILGKRYAGENPYPNHPMPEEAIAWAQIAQAHYVAAALQERAWRDYGTG
jgi:hypothetical protein